MRLYIKSTVPNASSLVHDGVTYKVIDGIADVPVEVRNDVTKYPVWQDVTEEVDKKTQDALAKANKSKKSDE